MCDLHLPFDKNALQYDVLHWAIADILQTRPDGIAFVGDATCDGNEAVYDFFISAIREMGLPFFYIPGNSDLRCKESRASIRSKASPCQNDVDGLCIFAINDCDTTVSDAQLEALMCADEHSIVFMHHPLDAHCGETLAKLTSWRKTHQKTMLFYGHLHRFETDGTYVSLPALDPDKSIGESPCLTYYDTETGELHKTHYPSPVPTDIDAYFGISCYRVLAQIEFAIQNRLQYLELRPNCVNCDIDELTNAIDRWREAGGKHLSVHLPDISWTNGTISCESHFALVEIVKTLKADRVTQHVPKVSVKEVRQSPELLEKICECLAKCLEPVSHDIVIGVENMHMTAEDTPDAKRRFGYIPEECLEFMHLLSTKTRHTVGINFDIGHARNNAPFSQKYQISTWLSMLGQYIVGYHIHQVTYADGVFENHMPITEVYGHLISYASFFRCWSTKRINKAPIIFEMRPENAYEITLNTFRSISEK